MADIENLYYRESSTQKRMTTTNSIIHIHIWYRHDVVVQCSTTISLCSIPKRNFVRDFRNWCMQGKYTMNIFVCVLSLFPQNSCIAYLFIVFSLAFLVSVDICVNCLWAKKTPHNTIILIIVQKLAPIESGNLSENINKITHLKLVSKFFFFR